MSKPMSTAAIVILVLVAIVGGGAFYVWFDGERRAEGRAEQESLGRHEFAIRIALDLEISMDDTAARGRDLVIAHAECSRDFLAALSWRGVHRNAEQRGFTRILCVAGETYFADDL